MLTGLLFAIEEATDDPAQLVATLPFAGTTLIEHQARQLLAAGAEQIIIFGERRGAALLDATQRIGRRGISVDAAGCAAEVVTALHPLARVVMLADGLITTDAVVRLLSPEGGNALLLLPVADAPANLERIGGANAWAGVARLSMQCIADLAELPPDYDAQSTLLRLAEASGASRLPLPATALRDGHGIERDAASLAVRGQRIVAAAVPAGRDWFDRCVSAPLARVAVPALATREVETTTVGAVAGVVATIGGAALIADWRRCGLLLAFAAMLVAVIGIAIARLRDQPGMRRGLHLGVQVIAAAAMVLLGWRCADWHANGSGLAIAIALVAATTLTERTGAIPTMWWSSAPSCAFVVTAATLLGLPVVGLAAAACYATATLAAAIERLRQA